MWIGMRISLGVLLLAAATLLTACIPTGWAIDEAWSPAQTAAIVAALDEWRAVCGVPFHVDPSSEHVVRRLTQRGTEWIPTASGSYYDGQIEILNLEPGRLYIVARHELGHALGLSERDDPGHVMSRGGDACQPAALPVEDCP